MQTPAAELVKVPYGESYYVSKDGSVFSLRGGELRCLLPQAQAKTGHKRVRLYDHGVRKDFFVHRLVAEAFVPNPECYPVVNHKDENPANNKAENLEWCTVAYNNTYGTALGKKSLAMKARFRRSPEEHERMRRQSKNRVWTPESRKKISESRKIPVVCCLNGKVVCRYDSALAAEKATGVKRGNICKVLKGERRFAGGYEWKYAD